MAVTFIRVLNFMQLLPRCIGFGGFKDAALFLDFDEDDEEAIEPLPAAESAGICGGKEIV